ncbi:MAG TPA: hypothetical protein VFC78_17140 [Tepidisphaeraceae bacterium]|nr:hypothetical protein [Tepidisphaeraceae bacterium]
MIKSRALCVFALAGVLIAGCKDDKKKDEPVQPVPTPAHPSQPAPQATNGTGRTVPPTSVTPGIGETGPATAPAVDTSALIQAMQTDIKGKHWTAAEADWKKLDAVKGQLPESMRQTVQDLKAEIDAGKLVHGIKLPNFGRSGPATRPSAPPDTELNK